jgi:hypothetical protein
VSRRKGSAVIAGFLVAAYLCLIRFFHCVIHGVSPCIDLLWTFSVRAAESPGLSLSCPKDKTPSFHTAEWFAGFGIEGMT